MGGGSDYRSHNAALGRGDVPNGDRGIRWIFVVVLFGGEIFRIWRCLIQLSVPVFAVFMGWGILGERIGMGTWGALILVSLGLILINRKRA